MPEKLYNDIIVEQLREMEYAIRDGLALNAEQKREIILLCTEIIALAEENL